MKLLIIGALIVGLSVNCYGNVTQTASVSQTAQANDLAAPAFTQDVPIVTSKPLEKTAWGWSDWIWIGVIVIVTGVASSSAYNTRKPI